MTIDGVTYEVNWRTFRRGTSIFIPCLEPRTAKSEVLGVTKRLKMRVLMKVIIQDNVRGLRIWRM